MKNNYKLKNTIIENKQLKFNINFDKCAMLLKEMKKLIKAGRDDATENMKNNCYNLNIQNKFFENIL